LGAALFYPQLAARLVGGREVTWETAAYGWPALTVFVWTLLAALLATLGARAWHLVRGTARRELSEDRVVTAARLQGARSLTPHSGRGVAVEWDSTPRPEIGHLSTASATRVRCQLLGGKVAVPPAKPHPIHLA
jgi:hypothetical protein